MGEGLGIGRGPRGSEREREGGERATEGRGVRARRAGLLSAGPARVLVGCSSALLGRLAWASAGPVGLARAWAFSLFFELRQREKIK